MPTQRPLTDRQVRHVMLQIDRHGRSPLDMADLFEVRVDALTAQVEERRRLDALPPGLLNRASRLYAFAVMRELDLDAEPAVIRAQVADVGMLAAMDDDAFRLALDIARDNQRAHDDDGA